MKKILITGKNSYIGSNLKKYLEENFSSKYEIHCISLRNDDWKQLSFSCYNAIVHVAGLAHVDVDRVDEETKRQYYRVNADLTDEIAKKAVSDGVEQFIYLSSIIVYSAYKGEIIDLSTPLGAENFYGDSKLKAEEKLQNLRKENMKLAILRPPMIYGKGSKGNYPSLSKLAQRIPFFPATNNKRSMLYIENLCEFIRLLIENADEGVFFPQNREYSDTATLLKMIANAKEKNLVVLKWLHWLIVFAKRCPGKVGILSNKAFGNLYYSNELSEYRENYIVCDLEESIKRTEG